MPAGEEKATQAQRKREYLIIFFTALHNTNYNNLGQSSEY